MLDLIVNAEKHRGWERVRLEYGLDQLASAFELLYVEHGAESAYEFPLFEGDRCSIAEDGATLITGYIDEAPARYDSKSHSLSVKGRSRVADLVDCSAQVTAGQLKGRTLTQIAQAICAPFGVAVITEADVGAKFGRFDVESGQSCFELLDLAARQRGVLLTSSRDGDLLITRAGNKRTSTVLKYGLNILSGAKSGSWAERFSEYILRGQTAGSDDWSGKKASTPRASASDSYVLRHRPLVLVAENEGTKAELQRRADWECNTRAGRSQQVVYHVRGWKNAEGYWQPNTVVVVDDPQLRIHGEMVISRVSMTLDDGGKLCELTLVRREAFDVQPLPKPKRRKGGASFFEGI